MSEQQIQFHDEQETPIVEQQQVQQPITEEQKPIQEEQKPAVEQVVNYKEKFGYDENEILERLSKFDEINSLAEQLKTASPYKTDESKQIDELMSEGLSFSDAVEFLNLDIEKMKPLEKIILHYKQTTAKGMESEDIEAFIKEQLGNFDWDELTPSQKIRLNEMTEKANAYLVEKKQGLKNNATKRHEVVQGKENLERTKAWEAQIPKLIDKQLSFKTEAGDVVFEVSKEEQAEISSIVLEHLQEYDLSKKESLDYAKEVIKNATILRNLPKIIEIASKVGASKKLDTTLETLENPSLQRVQPTRQGQNITFNY